MPDNIYPISELVLVYRSAIGEIYRQPASDLMEVGTLIDPETDEDMEMIGWDTVSKQRE